MAQKTLPGGTARPDRPPAPRNDHRDAFQRGTTVQSAEDQMVRATALEDDLETLRIHFEQYFLGLVRKPPTQERAAVRNAVLQLKSGFIRNTAVKFRVNALHNRYLAYERMWDRTLREIEEGTYRRDLFKARLHRGRGAVEAPAPAVRRGTAPPPVERDDFDVDEDHGGPEETAGAVSDRDGRGATGGGPAAGREPVGDGGRGVSSLAAAGTGAGATGQRGPGGGAAVTTPIAAKAPAESSSASGRGAPLGGLDDAAVRRIHAAYLEARRTCRESTAGLSVEAVGAALRKQVPGLLAKHGAKTVDFQVVIQNGKAILKAFPK